MQAGSAWDWDGVCAGDGSEDLTMAGFLGKIGESLVDPLVGARGWEVAGVGGLRTGVAGRGCRRPGQLAVLLVACSCFLLPCIMSDTPPCSLQGTTRLPKAPD